MQEPVQVFGGAGRGRVGQFMNRRHLFSGEEAGWDGVAMLKVVSGIWGGVTSGRGGAERGYRCLHGSPHAGR